MKKINKEEIDLIDVYLIIRKNFISVILITIIPAILSIIYHLNQNPNQIKYNVKTTIEPISIFNISEYYAYNNYLKNYYYNNKLKIMDEGYLNESLKEIYNINITPITNNIDNEQLFINEKTLINLFIDKIKERKIFQEGIKNFDLINKENFESEIDYENAVNALANSIIINKSSQEKENLNWNIQFQISNINKLDLFLLFIEEEANEEVRKYINQYFNNLVENHERLNKYYIEDLDIEILNSKDNLGLKNKLLKKKELIILNKHTQRLKKLFLSTPVTNSTNFYAANILTHSTKLTNVTKKNASKKIILIISFISFVFGIFFVLVRDSIQNRKT